MKTKVWILLGGIQYDGWDDPIGIFTTEEKAEKALAKQREPALGGAFEIQEYVLDVVENGAFES